MNIEDIESLPPYCSPKWCDHGPIVKTCSRCDPSESSGRIRAKEAKAQSERLRHLNPFTAYQNPRIQESLVRANEEEQEQ